ncbi:MAG TPA: ChaN family lipoprotein [Phycisphaerales bacterium]|nr:ChaN family lipoprotein [Phycisphaerales bacterium]
MQDALGLTSVHTSDGRPATWDEVVSRSRLADVVVIAELHGHPIGLSAAAALWRSLLDVKGVRPALALEFFGRDDQSRIDDYLTSPPLVTEEVFLRRTGKTTTPGAEAWAGGYPPGHRDMVEAARAAQPPAPVIAANAPRQYVRLARTAGYAALANLTHEQQRLFVLPAFAADGARPENRYWVDFLAFMNTTPEKYRNADAAEREKADSMFRAQSVWDATMADSVRQTLARGYAPVVLVIGQFHADFADAGGGGTVQALKAVRPETRIVVISFQDVDPAAQFRDQDRGRADFVVYTGSGSVSPVR